MNDKGKENVENYQRATGRMMREQSTPRNPRETLVKKIKDKVKQDGYRSTLGKAMFYRTKNGLECSFAAIFCLLSTYLY